MRLLLFIVVVLFVAASLALLAIENPGYVLIAREPWSVEMPLTLFVALTVIGVIVLYFVWHLLLRVARTPREVSRWRQLRHTRKTREALVHGLISLAEGNWVEAEKQLLSNLRYSDAPLLNYLAAAFAAQGQGNSEKRDEYLAQAHQRSPESSLAIGMAQAQLQYLAKQYEMALATLTQLRNTAPKNAHVLRLLVDLYRELYDWESLANLIADLRKLKVLKPEELEALELRTQRELLMLSLPRGAAGTLKQAWNTVPHRLRQQPELIEVYARHLLEQGEMDECESLLSSAIEREWNDGLVQLYGKVAGTQPATQLATAEEWLAHQSDNPILLLTLGRIAMRNRLLDKARGYLEQSITLRGPVEAYQELGGLLEQLGERDKALEHYRRALELCAQGAATIRRAGGRSRAKTGGIARGASYYGY